MNKQLIMIIFLFALIPTYSAKSVSKIENDYYERITADIDHVKAKFTELATWDDDIRKQLEDSKNELISLYADYKDMVLLPLDFNDVDTDALVDNLKLLIDNSKDESKLVKNTIVDEAGNIVAIEISSDNQLLVRSNFIDNIEVKRELFTNGQLTRVIELDSKMDAFTRTDLATDAKGQYKIKRLFYEDEKLVYAILYNRDQSDFKKIDIVKDPAAISEVYEYSI